MNEGEVQADHWVWFLVYGMQKRTRNKTRWINGGWWEKLKRQIFDAFQEAYINIEGSISSYVANYYQNFKLVFKFQNILSESLKYQHYIIQIFSWA